jgi:hypothetical protein
MELATVELATVEPTVEQINVTQIYDNSAENTETSSLSDNDSQPIQNTTDLEDSSSTTNEIEEYILGSDLIILLQNVLESLDENTQYNGKYIELFDIIQSM